MRAGLSKEQRKSILHNFSHQIAPWFQQPEILSDFLTDSYNVGGATSLLALSGIYYLISEKNLDYPSFYLKLYSLLDEGLLHSKHRSRFFRLLDTFMSSSHLPANLVASFIKRLSRLALHGPPAGVVVVIPWVYNMFKRHPACTFMMHREIRDPALQEELEEEGMDDPFDMEELDPLLTNAIDSSVWELEALQSHYHPNVATLAKIISEQFTKRAYNLEDFLDHSYTALLDVELDRDLKKEPEVEFEIPKRIFTAEEGLNTFGQLFTQVVEAR
jgi:U3 small nucleolar RNA-associated protein 19